MAGDEVPEQTGVGGGEGVGSVRGRRKSADFIQKSQLFEEKKFEGCVGGVEELLVVDCPEKPRYAFRNFTELTAKIPSTSPGPSSKFKKRCFQQKLCVVRQTEGVRGGVSLFDRSANRKQARNGDRESGGDNARAAKKLKVFSIFL